jgi:hypothetical protein
LHRLYIPRRRRGKDVLRATTRSAGPALAALLVLGAAAWSPAASQESVGGTPPPRTAEPVPPPGPWTVGQAVPVETRSDPVSVVSSDARQAYARGLLLLESDSSASAVRSFEAALARGYQPPEEAWLGLGRAHRRLPLHAFRAIGALRSAIRTEPAPLEALYEYADAYLQLDGWEGEREGRRALLRILQRDPDYRDAFERWAALYPDREEMAEVARELTERVARELTDRLARKGRAPTGVPIAAGEGIEPAATSDLLAARAADLRIQLEEPAAAARVLGLWRSSTPAPPSAWHYWTARLLFLEGREGEATAAFTEGLAAATTPADLAPYRRDLESLLGPEELTTLSLLDVAAQVEAIRAFWETRDLTPFSPANERLAEHYRRLAEARRRYLWKKPLSKEKTLGEGIDDLGRPSFVTRAEGRALDDRGTLYLLHGEPDRRHVELGGAEFWSYRRPDLPGGRLQFHFKRMAGPMGVGNDAVYSIAPTTDLGLGNVRRGRELEDGVAHTRRGLETDTWSEDSRQPLRLTVRAHTFRNADDPSRTDVVLAVAGERREGGAGREPSPDERARAEGPGRTPAAAGDLVRRLRLYRSGFVAEEDLADTVRAVGEGRESVPAGTLEIGARIPGTLPYALELEEVATGAFGALRGELEVPSYAGDGPRLSSVVLARPSPSPPGAADAPAADGATFRRGGAALQALVTPQTPRGRPVHLYYEIYGVSAGPGGMARYRIEYRVTSASERPGVLSRLFGKGRSDETGEVSVAFEQERPGPVAVAAETFALDTRPLEPGSYALTVAVLDRGTGREVERSVELEVVE